MIREQKPQKWGTGGHKCSGNTNGYRKEMKDVDIKQRKRASTARRKKELLI